MAKSHGRPRGRQGKPPSKIPPHIRRARTVKQARGRDQVAKDVKRMHDGMTQRQRRIMAGAENPDETPDLVTGQLELAPRA